MQLGNVEIFGNVFGIIYSKKRRRNYTSLALCLILILELGRNLELQKRTVSEDL